MPDRQAKIERQTKETSIELELNIDGSGQSEISTGIYMFDHLLQQVARHGVFDIKLKASGDDPHHDCQATVYHPVLANWLEQNEDRQRPGLDQYQPGRA